MKKIALTITLLLFLNLTSSQKLIPAAEKVKIAFNKLQSNKTNEELQNQYIKAFPSDTKTFLKVFHSDKFDQLYSQSYEYVQTLKLCANNLPNEVVNKSIDIGKNLVWDADATGYLQHLIVELSYQNPNSFISKCKSLNTSEKDKLISFLADVENHKAYKIYQKLIDKLNELGYKEISNKLIRAREIRKLAKDH